MSIKPDFSLTVVIVIIGGLVSIAISSITMGLTPDF